MDLHGDALNRIMGDMDDMESKKMTGGATITITVTPGSDSSDEGGPEGAGDLPADNQGAEPEEDALKMAAGGQVPAAPVPADVDDTRLPPFLRKKKTV